MAHGITATDGVMITGEAAWHRLGTVLDNPQTAAEAIEIAGLDWSVVEQSTFTRDLDGTMREVPFKNTLVRSDSREILSVMNKTYTPLQNRDAFQFFDEVIGQGEAIYHTAGSLFGGKQVWILAKLPEDIEVIKGDKVQPYILLSNSHDGSRAMRMQFTPIRVVCSNTLSAAMGADRTGFYARHSSNILDRVSEARDALGLAKAYYEMFASVVDQLVNTKFNEKQTADYIKTVYSYDFDKEYDKQHHLVIRSVEDTMELLNHPTNTLNGIEGTAWSAFNAVTYYIDHEKNVRSNATDKDSKRVKNSWFGRGSRLRQRAFDLVTARV